MRKFETKIDIIKFEMIDALRIKILGDKKSEFLNIDQGIKTEQGTIDRIEVDSAGIYVSLDKQPKKLIELPIETIAKITDSIL